MSLTSGTRLGPYEVVAPLGAGGMGEVYRARDTRLDRPVALKVLPQDLAADPQFRERFDREARSVAALNHPHICTLHDVGHHDGAHFLVMELIDGDTLADRLRDGPLAIDDTLHIAEQIADAVEAAHERGILHRDLKPANIKITPDGSVKVLDFGLAKLIAPAEAGALKGSPEGPGFSPGMSNSPTLSRMATLAGMVMGTAAYMSPEQARGKPVDRRTDVWAFGCVLYEMLTGRPAYDGETVTDILGAIVHKEPDWTAIPADTPPRLRELLRRCLQKDARLRLRDMGDVRLDILAARDAPAASIDPIAPAVPPRSQSWAIPAAVSALVATVVVLLVVAAWRDTTTSPVVARLFVEVSPNRPFNSAWGQAVVLSPDGSQLVYAGGVERRLYLRPLNRLESTALLDTEGAVTPFFSPDGQWIGFFSGETLKKVAIGEGASQTIATVGQGRGASWGVDNTIVFTADANNGLSRIAVTGGKPEPITTLDVKAERSHRWPQHLPGRNAVLFSVQPLGRRWEDSTIEVVDLDSKVRTVVHRGGSYPRYLASGHLAFVRGSTLYAAPFDVEQLRLTANPVPVLEGVGAQSGESGSGIAMYDVARNGTLVYLSGTADLASGHLLLVDRKGVTTQLSAEQGAFFAPRFAHDGQRVVVSRGGPPDLYVYPIAQQTNGRRLTFTPIPDSHPTWTRDGSRVAFQSNRAIMWTPTDGSGQPEVLYEHTDPLRPTSFSPDGKLLAFSQTTAERQVDISILRLDAGRKPEAFIATPSVETAPEFSPDGRWIAYHAVEGSNNRAEVYVKPYPDTGGKWQLSQGGGEWPRWSQNGKEIVYRISGDRFMSVAITSSAGASLQYDPPRELFKDTFAVRGTIPTYDVSPDGQRFVIVQDMDAGPSGTTHATIVFNWFEELRSRIGVSR